MFTSFESFTSDYVKIKYINECFKEQNNVKIKVYPYNT